MITSLAKVRNRLGLAAGEPADTMLTDQIQATQGRFEAELGRKLSRLEGQVQEFDAGQTCVLLDRYPVEDITKWEVWEDGVWREEVDVVLAAKLQAGVVSLNGRLGQPGGVARVTYTGGFVLPDGGGIGLYPLPTELEAAAVETVAHWYQWKDKINVNSEGDGTGNYRTIRDAEWVPWVKVVLNKYRRMVL
ncbi:MAG TPA: hypothetical protein VN673_01910 [Clostridia bacterium]|nr:hypothetical protein [Clostridia bacterium]